VGTLAGGSERAAQMKASVGEYGTNLPIWEREDCPPGRQRRAENPQTRRPRAYALKHVECRIELPVKSRGRRSPNLGSTGVQTQFRPHRLPRDIGLSAGSTAGDSFRNSCDSCDHRAARPASLSSGKTTGLFPYREILSRVPETEICPVTISGSRAPSSIGFDSPEQG
jgi:hypothetical protein